MSSKRHPEEFKIESVKQVIDQGHSVTGVARRLGTTPDSLYAWIKKYGPEAKIYAAASEEKSEIKRLKKELKRVTDESDILKKPR